MEIGPPLVAKILYNYKTDGASLAWAQNNLRGEVMIHNILSRRCPESLPVPLVLASDFDPNNPIGAPFMVMSKMEGEDQWLAWAKLTLPQKVVITTAVHCMGSDLWTIELFVASVAEAMIEMFQVSLPAIGTINGLQDDSQVTVGPFLMGRVWSLL